MVSPEINPERTKSTMIANTRKVRGAVVLAAAAAITGLCSAPAQADTAFATHTGPPHSDRASAELDLPALAAECRIDGAKRVDTRVQFVNRAWYVGVATCLR